MIALIALGAAVIAAPRPQPRPQAIATVRILKPVSASEKDWLADTAAHRREIMVREKDGRLTAVRLIEHE
jgi:hypothetical protein